MPLLGAVRGPDSTRRRLERRRRRDDVDSEEEDSSSEDFSSMADSETEVVESMEDLSIVSLVLAGPLSSQDAVDFIAHCPRLRRSTSSTTRPRPTSSPSSKPRQIHSSLFPSDSAASTGKTTSRTKASRSTPSSRASRPSQASTSRTLSSPATSSTASPSSPFLLLPRHLGRQALRVRRSVGDAQVLDVRKGETIYNWELGASQVAGGHGRERSPKAHESR